MTRTRWATWRGILSATLKGSGSSSSSAVSARADGDGVNREKRLGDDTTCGLTGTERRSAGTERKAVTTARPQSSEAKALPLFKPVPRSQAYQVCSSVRASDWEVSRHFQRKKEREFHSFWAAEDRPFTYAPPELHSEEDQGRVARLLLRRRHVCLRRL